MEPPIAHQCGSSHHGRPAPGRLPKLQTPSISPFAHLNIDGQPGCVRRSRAALFRLANRSDGGFLLPGSRRSVRIDIQPREFRLLEYLLRHKDQVVTRTMMLEGVWEYHFDPGTNVVDVHVSRLRRKIDDGFAQPLLHTVRGAGYMLGRPE